MKRFGATLALLLAVFGCNNQKPATDVTPSKSQAPSNTNLKPVPEFDLVKVAGGSLKADELKGKVVVVDFWATWCQPCISEIPNFNKLHEKYSGKNVEVLGVTIESGSLEDIKPKVEELQMKYPVVVGDDKTIEGFGGLLGYPTTFLVTQDGKIYKRYLGALPNKHDSLQKDIETLLAQDRHDISQTRQ